MKPTEVTSPAASAAVAMSLDWAAETPMGFSIQKGLPAFTASSAISWCR